LTSARLIRLWMIARRDADLRAVAAVAATQRNSPEPRADARIVPTVKQPDALETHVGMVYRYAMRLTRRADLAEDVTQ